ncbi:MAG: hypothetical protein JXR03_09655 [Cyclobacteriaceae bacterium]
MKLVASLFCQFIIKKNSKAISLTYWSEIRQLCKAGIISFSLMLLLVVPSFSQESGNIVQIIDNLTVKWDYQSTTIRSYKGFGRCCTDAEFKTELIGLLNSIHHYDTTLYQIVTSKFEASKDKEAKATLDDIELLESEYATAAFLDFLQVECDEYKKIEDEFAQNGGAEYQKSLKHMDKEIAKYVKSITHQIDIIDEHVHHLHGL